VQTLAIDLVVTGRPLPNGGRKGWLRNSSDCPAPWAIPCQTLAV
jgi:hypothetical protein